MGKERTEREMTTIEQYCKSCHAYARRQGFWNSMNSNESHIFKLAKLALITSEVGEAIEAVRKDDEANLAEECADIFIRLADFCEAYGISLAEAIEDKMHKNEKRERMHGKNS